MLTRHPYPFFAFYRYLNPGFLPLRIPQLASIFSAPPRVPLTAPYRSPQAAGMEQAYRNWLQGSDTSPTRADNVTALPELANLHDNYLFIRRNFSSRMYLYVLLYRLCTLQLKWNEPLMAWRVFRANHALPQVTLAPATAAKVATARVSVIIPTRNRYATLRRLLTQLCSQTLQPAEIIVIDQSEHIDRSLQLPDSSIPFHHLTTVAGAQASARNAGIRLSSGDYIASVDDDCEVGPDFLMHHLQTFLATQADVSTGPYVEPQPGESITETGSGYCPAVQFPAGNFMSTAAFFRDIGLFDEALDGEVVEDAELFIRAARLEKRMVCNFSARVIHYHLPHGGLRSRLQWFPELQAVRAFMRPAVLRFYSGLMPPGHVAAVVSGKVLLALQRVQYQPVAVRLGKIVILLLCWPLLHLSTWYHASRITRS